MYGSLPLQSVVPISVYKPDPPRVTLVFALLVDATGATWSPEGLQQYATVTLPNDFFCGTAETRNKPARCWPEGCRGHGDVGCGQRLDVTAAAEGREKWQPDSGATEHMTLHATAFKGYTLAAQGTIRKRDVIAGRLVWKAGAPDWAACGCDSEGRSCTRVGAKHQLRLPGLGDV